MKLSKLTAAVALALASAMPWATAHADPLTSTTFLSFALDDPGTAAREGWAYTNNVISGASENPQTGQWRLSYEGTIYDTFCIEPTQALRFGDEYKSFRMVSAISSDPRSFSPAQVDRLSRLYESFYEVSRLSAENSAAFQLAVWEILYDSTLDLSSGEFKTVSGTGPTDTNSAVLLTSNTMLSGLDARASGQWDFQRLINPVIQDQLIANKVPLPSSAWLLGLGFLALRRKTKKA